MTEAQELADRDPKQDFEAAKKNGDIHLFAVMGFVTDVPGVEGSAKAFLKRVPVHVIEGTSDVLGPGQDRRVREKVRAYAETYNQLVIKFLREQKHSGQ